MRLNNILTTICGYRMCGDWCPFLSNVRCEISEKSSEEIVIAFENFIRAHPDAITKDFDWTEYERFRSKLVCAME